VFGLYRLVLAWCVVIEHISGSTLFLSHTGMFAVFGFYVLSGYLITRVLHDNYGFAIIPFWVKPHPANLPGIFPPVCGRPRAHFWHIPRGRFLSGRMEKSSGIVRLGRAGRDLPHGFCTHVMVVQADTPDLVSRGRAPELCRLVCGRSAPRGFRVDDGNRSGGLSCIFALARR
jgi:hypothetical protein